MNEEAMKLALEALRRSRKSVSGDLDLAGCAYGSNDPDGHRYDDAKKALTTLDKAITALKEALAQPEQEPVAIVDANDDGYWAEILPDRSVKVGQLLYTTPPQRKPLTDEEIASIYMNHTDRPLHAQWNFARAIEAAHGIKEKK